MNYFLPPHKIWLKGETQVDCILFLHLMLKLKGVFNMDWDRGLSRIGEKICWRKGENLGGLGLNYTRYWLT